jgi:hypothetical protein
VPVAKLAGLVVAILAVIRLLTLQGPDRATSQQSAPSPPLALAAPTWSGPVPVRVSGNLADGTAYVPRIFVNPATSIGVAPSADGKALRVLLRTADARVTELRRAAASDVPQFDGFAASGSTVVWAESVSRSDSPVRTTLYRADWKAGTKAFAITTDTGDATFLGSQYDLVLRAGRVYWSAVAAGRTAATEVRSVAVSGGSVTVQRVTGAYTLSTWPWVVSAGGHGTPVQLLNLQTRQRLKVATATAETAVCGPRWCRIGVIADNELARIEVQHTDGNDRHRIAGNEATPTIVDVSLLDRFVPLATDRGDNAPGVGLSLYDLTTGRTDLVALEAENVGGRDSMLWWSTGSGDDLVWNAVDLRALP